MKNKTIKEVMKEKGLKKKEEIKYPIKKYDKNGNEIYLENSNGYWKKRKYDENDNLIYWKDSDGYWEKRKYNKNGNEIYLENSNGYWEKRKYNKNGNEIYLECSDGSWRRKEGENILEYTYGEYYLNDKKLEKTK